MLPETKLKIDKIVNAAITNAEESIAIVEETGGNITRHYNEYNLYAPAICAYLLIAITDAEVRFESGDSSYDILNAVIFKSRANMREFIDTVEEAWKLKNK